MNDIPTIAHNLRTQDSRITANPIFIVQQKRRIGGFEIGYSYDYVWVNRDSEEVDESVGKLLDQAEEDMRESFKHPDDYDGETRPVKNYRKVYYRDEYVFVQPFLTEHGAQQYLKINSHNLREPRIYVEGGWRNEEWEMVRGFLMGLKT